MLVLSVPLLDHPVHMPAVYLPLLVLSLLVRFSSQNCLFLDLLLNLDRY